MRRSLVASMLLGLMASGCPKGYEFHRVPGEQRVVSFADVELLASDARKNCADAEPQVHCEKHPEWCSRDSVESIPRESVCGPHLQTSMSFVHLSDAQLKEHQISLRGPMGEGGYDHLTPGSARNPDLERNDFAVLLATVLGVNSLAARDANQNANAYAPCPQPRAPSFVLHTGDAVDAGMFSEFFEFLSIMKLLDVPFYNAVGNHDNLFFGTFPKHTMSGLDVTLPFVPIGDTRQFLEAHNPDAAKRDYSIPYLPGLDHGPTNQVDGCEPDTDEEEAGGAQSHEPRICQASTHHGFDLFCPEPRKGGGKAASLCLDARGYYGQDILLPAQGQSGQRRIRLLVLNTSENFPLTKDEALKFKSRAKMSDRQLMWLSNELSAKTELPTVFLVAGHHTLDSFMPAQEHLLRDLLIAEPRVAAYLGGHTHRNALRKHVRKSGLPLREITSGSTLVYPQLGNLIDVLEDRESERVYLRVRSFRQGLTDQKQGTCRLKTLAQRGRDGAREDTSDNAWTDEDESVKHSNALFQVTGFKKGKR